MIKDYKKHDLFGKTLIQKIGLTSPFRFDFPVSDQACFLYVLDGEVQYQQDDHQFGIPRNYSLLLNCVNSGKQIHNADQNRTCEIVIVTFYPEILKKVYDRELPSVFQTSGRVISNKSSGKINSDFLIEKYIEGLLFYFENPSLISEEILVLKMKEIILLLAQTPNAQVVQSILSQIFSPATYTFKQIIEANLFSHSGVEHLAELTNLSLSSFKREFAKLYKDTPASYIKNKRLERSAALLLISDQRITDIAFDCGFNDLANFTRSFNDKYKTSPTHYRKQLKGN
jgi:AraC-like DNA-binding protein